MEPTIQTQKDDYEVMFMQNLKKCIITHIDELHKQFVPFFFIFLTFKRLQFDPFICEWDNLGDLLSTGQMSNINFIGIIWQRVKRV